MNVPFLNIEMKSQRWSEMPLILGRSGTQYAAMVKTVKFVLWSTFSTPLHVVFSTLFRFLYNILLERFLYPKLYLNWEKYEAPLQTVISTALLSSNWFIGGSTHFASRTGAIFWRVLATLKRTLATESAAKPITTGSMSFTTLSGPMTSAKTCNTTSVWGNSVVTYTLTTTDKKHTYQKIQVCTTYMRRLRNIPLMGIILGLFIYLKQQ